LGIDGLKELCMWYYQRDMKRKKIGDDGDVEDEDGNGEYLIC
jgi:hypothetical protein